jgi:hypothetical protein
MMVGAVSATNERAHWRALRDVARSRASRCANARRLDPASGAREAGARARFVWVAPGDCSPRAPTDPDVRISRIRFFEQRIYYAR